MLSSNMIMILIILLLLYVTIINASNNNVTYVRIQQTTNELINLVEVELYYNNTKIPLSGTIFTIHKKLLSTLSRQQQHRQQQHHH